MTLYVYAQDVSTYLHEDEMKLLTVVLLTENGDIHKPDSSSFYSFILQHITSTYYFNF